ncbi:Endonuclease/exonuclease/phosphatase [Thalictrum thalictroides]|uniref:Endonuclease/exonuclease/phosphatase n=1 Tax=Thalictrum thalictroides TaxID=46969 RepID=A0A7J6WK36_THATH|nr:Endonuclease/exonuclease/phosphatase [Thalictrum thalictroides]
MTPGISDHSPVVLRWNKHIPTTVKPFRFFNHWDEHKDFLNMVGESWQTETRGNPMMRVTNKLKTLKIKLKEWSKNHYSQMQTKISDAK